MLTLTQSANEMKMKSLNALMPSNYGQKWRLHILFYNHFESDFNAVQLSQFLLRVIIGAPKADTSQYQPGVREGGAVYRCDISDDNRCQIIHFDSNGELSDDSSPTNTTLTHKKITRLRHIAMKRSFTSLSCHQPPPFRRNCRTAHRRKLIFEIDWALLIWHETGLINIHVATLGSGESREEERTFFWRFCLLSLCLGRLFVDGMRSSKECCVTGWIMKVFLPQLEYFSVKSSGKIKSPSSEVWSIVRKIAKKNIFVASPFHSWFLDPIVMSPDRFVLYDSFPLIKNSNQVLWDKRRPESA